MSEREPQQNQTGERENSSRTEQASESLSEHWVNETEWTYKGVHLSNTRLLVTVCVDILMIWDIPDTVCVCASLVTVYVDNLMIWAIPETVCVCESGDYA